MPISLGHQLLKTKSSSRTRILALRFDRLGQLAVSRPQGFVEVRCEFSCEPVVANETDHVGQILFAEHVAASASDFHFNQIGEAHREDPVDFDRYSRSLRLTRWPQPGYGMAARPAISTFPASVHRREPGCRSDAVRTDRQRSRAAPKEPDRSRRGSRREARRRRSHIPCPGS